MDAEEESGKFMEKAELSFIGRSEFRGVQDGE